MPYNRYEPSQAFRGVIRPFAKKTTPTIWQRSTLIGTNGRYQTSIRMYLKPPSFQFPEASLFLQASNGNGSVFAKLIYLEISQLAADLQRWAEELKPILDGQEVLAAQLKGKMDAAYREVMSNPQTLGTLMAARVNGEFIDPAYEAVVEKIQLEAINGAEG